MHYAKQLFMQILAGTESVPDQQYALLLKMQGMLEIIYLSLAMRQELVN
jgi:hypothetical protein